MDNVKEPQHYKLFPNIEVIDIIRRNLTDQQIRGYYMGNILKYKLRAGDKGDGTEDLAKAKVYKEWLKDLGD